MIVVSVCLPSDVFSQHLPSYLRFSYLGRGVSVTLDVGYLLPWTWGISSWLLQQSTAAAPFLGRGVSPHCREDLERGIAPLGPPVPSQPLLLRCEVAPPSRCPWPWTWGSSSWLILRCRSLALSAAAPDLGCGVAPLSHAMCPGHSMCGHGGEV